MQYTMFILKLTEARHLQLNLVSFLKQEDQVNFTHY